MENLFLRGLDLQRFAEESSEDLNQAQNQGTDPNNSGNSENVEEKEYLKITQKELDSMFDRRLKSQMLIYKWRI